MKLTLKSALLKHMRFLLYASVLHILLTFGFHVNLKPCHPSFISDASPKAQLLFCHFCRLFACLCNALNMFPVKHIEYSHLPMLTQQENLSCLLVI